MASPGFARTRADASRLLRPWASCSSRPVYICVSWCFERRMICAYLFGCSGRLGLALLGLRSGGSRSRTGILHDAEVLGRGGGG